jgi:CubicO group peptidase (beta-lactamase class C family)
VPYKWKKGPHHLSYDTPIMMNVKGLNLVICVSALTVAVLSASPLASAVGRPTTQQTLPSSGQGRQITHQPLSGIDAWVARAMKTFEVPGLALTIVKDGQIVLAKGYGLKKLGEEASVDGQTLFGIASNTKAFTATALGMLVEEGKIRWDGRVIDYLPWFQMSDPYVTREMTVRDLLVHRSGLGLGAGDLLWWPASTYDRHEIARRLRFIPLATSFRSAYAYDNLLYLLAGEVIEAASSQSWEEFMSSRILTKVGMRSSNVRHSAAREGGNVATPHAPVDGRVRPIAPFDSDNTNPAGGINSCADDMAKWLLVQLAEGKLADGSRLFSEDTSRELMTMVTPMPLRKVPAELEQIRPNFYGYGLGFGVLDYRGKKLVSHTGGLPGYVSKVAMLPELKLGVSVLTNQESGAAFDSIVNHVLDAYLQAPDTDWIASYEAIVRRAAQSTANANEQAATARDAASKPSLPLAKYAGTYRDAWYGDVTISSTGNRLAIQFEKTPLLAGTLEHWQHDTFVARWKDRELRADAFVTFSLNPDGTIDRVLMRAVSSDTDFSYDFQDLLLRPVASRTPQP